MPHPPEAAYITQALPPLLEALAAGGQVRLLHIPRAPVAQARTGQDDPAQAAFERGLELRASTGMPFWDAVLLCSETAALGTPRSVFDAALLHQPLPLLQSTNLPIDSRLGARLEEETADVEEGHVVALTSAITLRSGEVLHLPMLDFASKSRRPSAREAVEHAAGALRVPGFLVESGQSYHFYGQVLVDASALRTFLTRAILLAPVADSRWVAHQLLEQTCSLRISPTTRGGRPRVVSHVR